ncbi:MOSC domain-containing protein [soil metagenome]
MTGILVSAHVYPVKSCAGASVPAAEVTLRGLRHDRSFGLADPDGKIRTQREARRLALARPDLSALDRGILTVTAPDRPDLREQIVYDGVRHLVRIWGDTVPVVDQGDEAADWFTTLTGSPCRLVRLPDDHVRAVDERFGAGEVSLADGFPLLLTSTASLADLQARIGRALPMDRFRPNLVIDGWDEPFVEDTVTRLAVGEMTFELVKPCGRCVITTTDQATAERGHEPLATLATYRRGEFGLHFGQNAVPVGTGTVRVGDPVRIIGV